MNLLTEEELHEYVEYWGGSLETLVHPDYRKGRALAAVTFYTLHHPEQMPSKAFWQRTIKQAVTFLWTRLKAPNGSSDWQFRTAECKAYFQQLFDGYIKVYGAKEVFRFRYQNWYVVDCPTMIDQLWTVQEKFME